MGPMDKTSSENTQKLAEISDSEWQELDQRIRRSDELRWLSSRYAPRAERQSLIALYAFIYELAKIPTVVSEPLLGAIRFQWWRETLEKMIAGEAAPAHYVVHAMSASFSNRLDVLEKCLAIIEKRQDCFEDPDLPDSPHLIELETACLLLAPSWTTENAKMFSGGDFSGQVIPLAVRPALAQVRLERAGKVPEDAGPLSQRLSIMLAVLTGRISQ